MKILIFGGSGMLGHKLAEKLKARFEVAATFRKPHPELAELDFFRGVELIEGVEAENVETVEKTLRTFKPDVVVNAVGVIKQLPISKDVIKTLDINSIFPHRLAGWAAAYDFRLITISTDCVFNGRTGDYTEESIPDAEDLYGKSKNLGEPAGENCLTLRTSIIGRELSTAHSLVEWFLGNRGGRVKGFRKAIYTGFPTAVLAGILEMIISDHPELNGLYHVSSEKISKYELLKLIDREFGAGVEIEPDDEFELDRSLDSSRFRAATGYEPPDWETLIKIMAADTEVYERLSK